MESISIIEKYYEAGTNLHQLLIKHCRSVADKALAIAMSHPEMDLDLNFIEEAAMLHDIGIIFCNAPNIDCHGTFNYICHGYLGADLLRKEGYPRHALVCERHTGTGISLQMIIEKDLPLPHKDFLPVSLEEQLICFADKFFSKTQLDREKDVARIQKSLLKHGKDAVLSFNHWHKLFLG